MPRSPKAFATSKCRETVAWGPRAAGRQTASSQTTRLRAFFRGQPRALYSYEGTYQIQNLILGKAITGLSAFV